MTQPTRHPTHPAYCIAAALLLIALGPWSVATGQEQPGVAMLSEDFEQRPLDGWELFGAAEIGQVNGGHALVFPGPGGAFPIGVSAGEFSLGFRYRPGHGHSAVMMCASGEPPRHQEYQLVFMPGEVLLARRQHERGQELAAAACEFIPGRWYTVHIGSSEGRIEVTVDGRQLMLAEDPRPLGPGGFGFLTGDGAGAAFDDIWLGPPTGDHPPAPTAAGAPEPAADASAPRVPAGAAVEAPVAPSAQPGEANAHTGPQQAATGGAAAAEATNDGEHTGPAAAAGVTAEGHDAAEADMPVPPPRTASVLIETFDTLPVDGWEFDGGVRVQHAGQAGALVCYSPGLGRWIGAGEQSDFALTYRYQHGQGTSQVVFRASGTAPGRCEYRLLMGSGGEARLVRLSDGHEEELAAVSHSIASRTWYDISIQVIEGRIVVRVGGRPLLEARDSDPLPAGGLGFGCIEGSGFAYDAITLTPGAALMPPMVVLLRP